MDAKTVRAATLSTLNYATATKLVSARGKTAVTFMCATPSFLLMKLLGSLLLKYLLITETYPREMKAGDLKDRQLALSSAPNTVSPVAVLLAIIAGVTT